MNESTATPLAKDRTFWIGWAVLLLFTALYTGVVLAQWAKTPLGRRPQGEAAAWLADGESLYRGTLLREPFFRAPAYLAVLALERALGVSAADLADGARWLNGLAHLLATALIAGLARRLSGRARGGWFAGALWGFYPPAVFLAAEPRPETLALLLWLMGVAAALGMVWSAPRKLGNRVSWWQVWVFPAMAGVAFMLAGAFYAPLWPAALAWPWVALLVGRESRGIRLLAAALGVGSVILGLLGLQILWGGSPQPLAVADLYRLARATEVTLPWAAPLPLNCAKTAPRPTCWKAKRLFLTKRPPGSARPDRRCWRIIGGSARWAKFPIGPPTRDYG